jgi:hypothetical protein
MESFGSIVGHWSGVDQSFRGGATFECLWGRHDSRGKDQELPPIDTGG